MGLTAAAMSAGLLLIIGLEYGINIEGLRHETLADMAEGVAAATGRGEDPAQWHLFQTYPNAYAFRVVDRLAPGGQRLLAGANPALLPPLVEVLEEADDTGVRYDERFVSVPVPGGDAWHLTSHVQVGDALYHVDVAMRGDPAWLWRFSLFKEMLADGLLPIGLLVPALTLAILLTTRRALQPLSQIAQQARQLGESAGSGQALTPLESGRLPREFTDVVTALNAMLDRLGHSLARQRQFASDAAHELRTPIAVLRLRVSTLPDTAMARELDGELAALAHLVDELLRFAHAEDVMASDRTPLDVVAVVRDACGKLAAKAVLRDQSLALEAPDEGLVLPSHAELLGAMVRNLVDNALGVSQPGTTVTIHVRAPGFIIVEDEGPGVPDAQKSAVFGRHWRAERQRREGAGLGLALVRRVAQLHGGDVWVEDRPGGGARFVVRLVPLA
jgi:signal transduction histidine kinase